MEISLILEALHLYYQVQLKEMKSTKVTNIKIIDDKKGRRLLITNEEQMSTQVPVHRKIDKR